MYLENEDWRELLSKADAFKAVGQTRLYLARAKNPPWELVTSVDPGAMHRLDMAVSCRFSATHESGLTFEWSIDIEDRNANGHGYYEINSKLIREVLEKLPEPARNQYRAYIADCAAKVQAKYREWKVIADRQKQQADALHELATFS